MSDSLLLTSEEYIEKYYTKLKNELNARGLQISRVGLIGLILHILGFTQQDIKLYYDTLFREAFLATADKYENIIMHGSIFGYEANLAKPALLSGKISFDTAALPIASDSDQTIILQDLKCKVDNLVYTLEAKYIFKGTNCQIIDNTGNITTVPVSITNPSVPIQEFKQYDTEEYSYTIPFYIFNSYYMISIDLNSEDNVYVADLDIEVQEDGEDSFVKYEYRTTSYSSGANDRHVFVQFLPNGKINIELGSGVHGKYIPNSYIKIKVKTTYGILGNISQQTVTPYDGVLRMYDNNNGNSYTIPVNTGISVEIDYGSVGTNALPELDLRQDIINFIRHRNNFVSERDFYDLFAKYLDDFELMFKKTHVMDNNIYVFGVLRNTYQLPVTTRSISVKHQDFNPNLKCFILNPTFTLENGEVYISPFLYIVDFNLRQYQGYILRNYISAYFNEIKVEYEPETGEEIINLPLTLYTIYNQSIDSTRLMVQSYESIVDYTFMLDIPKLHIENQCLTLSADNVADTYFFDHNAGTGIIFDKVDIKIKAYKTGKHMFTYTLKDFSMVNDISDILSLKTFDGFVEYYETETTTNSTTGVTTSVTKLKTFDDDRYTSDEALLLKSFYPDSYVLNIPVMKNSEFEKDSEFYMDKIVDLFGSLALEENRMISDDLQVRFLNSDVIFASDLEALSKQKYNFDIKFPLHLTCQIYGDTEYINENDVNTVTSKQELNDLLAKTLFTRYTGTNISFYETQIVEIIHDLKWVKWCSIEVTDDNGVKIPDNNLETNEQKYTLDALDKFGAVTYCPYYFWWDLDNIELKVTYE